MHLPFKYFRIHNTVCLDIKNKTLWAHFPYVIYSRLLRMLRFYFRYTVIYIISNESNNYNDSISILFPCPLYNKSIEINFIKKHNTMHILYHHQQIFLVIAWACLIDYNGGVRGLHSRNSFFLGVNVAAWVFVIVWFIGYLFMICKQIKLSNQMLIVSHVDNLPRVTIKVYRINLVRAPKKVTPFRIFIFPYFLLSSLMIIMLNIDGYASLVFQY